MSANIHMGKLEELLDRVKRNRLKLANERILRPEPKAPEGLPIPSEPPPAIEEELAPPPVEAAPITEPVMPEPVMPEPVDEEVRTFESTPVASGPVAQMDGHPTRKWTLKAVLNRAWNLGGRS